MRRAPGAATKRVAFGYAGVHFTLVQDSIEVPVPRENMRDASVSPGIDLGTRAVNMGMDIILRGLECERAALYLNASNYANSNKVALTSTAKWSDPASTPITAINQYREVIRQQVGAYPNLLTLSPVAFAAIRDNPSVRARINPTSAASVTEEILAKLLDIDKVVVGKAIVSDDAGTFTDIWGNNAILSYSAIGSIQAEVPSAAYTYYMNGHPIVEQPYWDQNTKSWVYGVTYERVPVMPTPGGMFLIQNPS
jgi:hypothetical protein